MTMTKEQIRKMTIEDVVQLTRDVLAGTKPRAELRPVLVYLQGVQKTMNDTYWTDDIGCLLDKLDSIPLQAG